MRGDSIVANQLLMAQGIFALAEHFGNSTGFALVPVPFDQLPTGAAGMLACISDSMVTSWGAHITGGGTETVLAFHNGMYWTVAGA